MKSGTKPLGESRSQAVRRFTSFERSLHVKGQFPEFKAVVDEYFESKHAEPVPLRNNKALPKSSSLRILHPFLYTTLVLCESVEDYAIPSLHFLSSTLSSYRDDTH